MGWATSFPRAARRLNPVTFSFNLTLVFDTRFLVSREDLPFRDFRPLMSCVVRMLSKTLFACHTIVVRTTVSPVAIVHVRCCPLTGHRLSDHHFQRTRHYPHLVSGRKNHRQPRNLLLQWHSNDRPRCSRRVGVVLLKFVDGFA